MRSSSEISGESGSGGSDGFDHGNKDEIEEKQNGLSNGLVLYNGIRTLNVETT